MIKGVALRLKLGLVGVAVVVVTTALAFVNLGQAADESMNFGAAFEWFNASAPRAVRLSQPADKLRVEILETCSVATVSVMSRATTDAILEQVLGMIKFKQPVSVAYIDALLGGMAAV
jgi:hypothetical protein